MRIPDEVLAMASDQAQRMGVSSNAYILMAIRNFIPYQETVLQQQAKGLRMAQSHMQGSGRDVPAPVPRVGVNQPCPCGSGKKYKQCHGRG